MQHQNLRFKVITLIFRYLTLVATVMYCYSLADNNYAPHPFMEASHLIVKSHFLSSNDSFIRDFHNEINNVHECIVKLIPRFVWYNFYACNSAKCICWSSHLQKDKLGWTVDVAHDLKRTFCIAVEHDSQVKSSDSWDSQVNFMRGLLCHTLSW